MNDSAKAKAAKKPAGTSAVAQKPAAAANEPAAIREHVYKEVSAAIVQVSYVWLAFAYGASAIYPTERVP